MAARADVVSVHVALTGDTRGMCGEAFFRAMKPGAIFLNAARAEVVDPVALEAAVREKGLRVGTDVPPNEPGGGTGTIAAALLGLAGVYGTHHVARFPIA